MKNILHCSDPRSNPGALRCGASLPRAAPPPQGRPERKQPHRLFDAAPRLRASGVMLLVSNIVPIVGVLALGWEIYPLVLLFWLENVLVGIFHVARLLLAVPSDKRQWLVKGFLIPFFCVHYGLFTFVHGVFVVGVFGGAFQRGEAPLNLPEIARQGVAAYRLGWGVAALAVSHGASFCINYLGHGEYQRADLSRLMHQPYSRVVVLHVAIVLGGFLMMVLQSPTVGLLALVILKVMVDLQAHLREHSSGAAAV